LVEKWRLEHPHDTPLHPVRPSPTFGATSPRSTWDVTFTDAPERTLVQTIVTYKSSDDLQKVIDMGMKEGLASTLERLDELLLTLNEQRIEG
jgi:uncharacterized protein YndB with AHSA1/START domain